MSNSHDLNFKKSNPLCAFCVHCNMKFFTRWCDKTNDYKNMDAKKCPYYNPTDSDIKKPAN